VWARVCRERGGQPPSQARTRRELIRGLDHLGLPGDERVYRDVDPAASVGMLRQGMEHALDRSIPTPLLVAAMTRLMRPIASGMEDGARQLGAERRGNAATVR